MKIIYSELVHRIEEDVEIVTAFNDPMMSKATTCIYILGVKRFLRKPKYTFKIVHSMPYLKEPYYDMEYSTNNRVSAIEKKNHGLAMQWIYENAARLGRERKMEIELPQGSVKY